MIAALAMIAAAPGLLTQPPAAQRAQQPGVQRAGGPGRVALLGRAFELEAEIARDLTDLTDLDAGGGIVRLVAGSGAEAAAEPLARSGVAVTRIDLDPAVLHAGDARDLSERVRAARCIELAGGDYLDWYGLLLPGGAPSRVGLAVREAHAAGALVLGSGPAASFLGEWVLIDRAALAKPVRNPREPDEDVLVEGLALRRGSLVDSSASERGSPRRLVRAAMNTGSNVAIFLDGDVAWIEDPREREAFVSGTGAVLLFDLSRARRLGRAVRDGRISLLSSGDRWLARAGVQPGPRTALHCVPAPTVRELARGLDAAELRRILSSEGPCGVFTNAELSLSIEADEDSFADTTTAGHPFGACGLRFDLEWLER